MRQSSGRGAVWVSVCVVLAALWLLPAAAGAQPRVTSPKEALGFNVGDDYVLATYTQMAAYWQQLDRESDRLILRDIGKTAEGRVQTIAIISSPENQARLEHFRGIASRLARAEGLTDDEARALAAEGKAVVWIDGGLHATEVVGAQQLIETVYQLVSRSDPETLRFLNDVIVLCVPANPDGMELVSSWYMRNPEPTKRSTAGIPRLYQKYAGHDNNRDSYMVNLAETANMHRVLYREWFPQILYNHHQTGPVGTVVFMPPFRDPFNYVYDPLIPLGVEAVGTAMHSRFVAEGKPGSTMRSGASYSTWWNGGLRTTAYFHNIIGLLTEIIGNPTPMEIPLVPPKLLASGDYPYPILPQRWHMRQSIDYEVSANRAVIDYASRNRDALLFNIYRMGKNAIEKGSRDTWTFTPREIDALMEQVAKDRPTQPMPAPRPGGGRGATVPASYLRQLQMPEARDPRGFVVPADQPDFPSAIRFVNTLIRNGITVHRASSAFTVAGKTYPTGSLVVKSAQAFRAHVLDMFEPQDHPNDFAYPGGPPLPPYDSAGWTPAFTTGIVFDRFLEAFDGPFVPVADELTPDPGTVRAARGTKVAGYLVSAQMNDAFRAANRLLAAREDVYRLTAPMAVGSTSWAPGTFYVSARPTTAAAMDRVARELGLTVETTSARVPPSALKLRTPRIGLWDRYGGSMPSGWTRLVLEQFEFPHEVVYAPTLDAGDLAAKYDVLIFVDGAIPGREGAGEGFMGAAPALADVPEEFRPRLGNISVVKTVPSLKAFVEQGGVLVAIGRSTSVARHFGLPVADALVERTPRGEERPLPSDKFYIPGSVLSVAVDNTQPLAWGLGRRADVFFESSPAFRLGPEALVSGVAPVAWYDSAKPLRSGWAWGQTYLEGTTAVADATVGKGRVVLLGPEVAFRAQPFGTYKFLFNGIYRLGGGRQ